LRRVTDPELGRAATVLHLEYVQPNVLRQALVVRSPRKGSPDPAVRAKERFEYLGDSVIDFLVSDHLFYDLPEASEGVLSALRAALVSASSLADIGERLGVAAALRIDGNPTLRGRSRLLASTVEALVGAIYCEAGIAAARDWIGPPLFAAAEELLASGYLPAKSRLQEGTQAFGRGTPRYQVVAVSGREHERTYDVEVEVEGQVLGRGSGPSRRAAEHAAAAAALDRLR